MSETRELEEIAEKLARQMCLSYNSESQMAYNIESALREQREAGRAERDALASQVATLTAERDAAVSRFDTLVTLKQHSVLCSGCSGKYHADNCIACDRDRLTAEVARLTAAGRAEGRAAWQPIDTAPKDGQLTLLYGRFEQRLAERPSRYIGLWFQGYSDRGWWTVSALPFQPTHWMVLPSAPGSEDV